MKRMLPVILSLLAISTPALAQKQPAGAKAGRTGQAGSARPSPATRRLEEQLKTLEQLWAQAVIKGDVATLNRILADDYIHIDAQGSIGNKTSTLAALSSREIAFDSIKVDQLTVRAYGGFAVVTGGEIVQMKAGEKSQTSGFRFTDVFALRAGRWQAISTQLTASSEVGLQVVQKADGTKEVTTISGLKYIDLVEGKGASPKPGQTVIVHYTGTLENGTKFDSSVDRGQPLRFPIGVGRVIKGWDEGLMSMKIGGRRKLIIPASLGYGERGAGNGLIPPNATLLFDVELLGVQ